MIALWIALIGSDRLDFLGGAGPSILAPFQVLTAAVLLGAWLPRLRERRWPTFNGDARAFSALLLALLALCTLSIVRAPDVVISVGRTVLFAATAVAVPLAIWGLSDRDDLWTQLARGAKIGIALTLVMDVVQVLAMFGALPQTLEFGTATLQLTTHTYGSLPRLAGLATDANRAGVNILFHSLLLVLGTPAGRERRVWLGLAAFALVGTVSRSAALATIAVLVWHARPLLAAARTRFAPGLAAACGVVSISSALMLQPAWRENTLRYLAPLEQRFSLSEGSAQSHADLLNQGVEVAMADVPTTMVGIGFGMAYRALFDYFGGNPYGNFHSSWLTFWAESGVVAMLLFAALLLARVPRAGPFAGLLIGLGLYAMFYNVHLEPLLWVTLGLVWLAPRQLARLEQAHSPAPAPHEA